MVGGAAVLAVAALAACGSDDDGGQPDVSSPTPTVTEPTPTQDVIASPIASYQDPERWRGRVVTVATFGGDYRDAQSEAYFRPFEGATGATVRDVVVDLAILKQQVEDGNVVWDVALLPTEEVLGLARDGYLTPIDYTMVDRTALFDEYGIAMQHAVGADFYSTGIAYPADATDVPQSWADFWDVARFGPGRALRKDRPMGTLEFALLADGVEKDKLYPLDVERAFASLERIYPHVISWYEDGQQPVQLVLSGTAGLASAWNIRVHMQTVEGQVAFQWNQAMLSANSWVVPSGAQNADVAMDFINYATRAVPNANFCRLLPFGPVNREALTLLRPDRLAMLPTAEPQRSMQFVENWNYWNDNREILTERYLSWLEAERDNPGVGTPASGS